MADCIIKVIQFAVIPRFPERVRRLLRHIVYRNQIGKWERSGKKVPVPHAIKTNTIIEFSKKYRIDTLIETGSYLGDTVDTVKNSFKKVYSIELDERLYKRAKKMFSSFKNVNIIKGDSTYVLPEVLKKVNKPAVFWLDAHYSGGVTAKGDKETPITQELEAILKHKIKNHIILIDDARLFDGKNDYPDLYWLKKYVNKKNPKKNVVVKNDIIGII